MTTPGDFMERARPFLQQRVADEIRIGLAYADLLEAVPSDAQASAVASWAELALQEGCEMLSLPEAALLARLARQNHQLADPAQVDLNDPAVHALNRELSTIWRCVDRRRAARTAQGGLA